LALAGRPIQWASQLEAPNAVGRVSWNGAQLMTAQGRQEGTAQSKQDDNRVDAEVFQAKGPGLWRFELKSGVKPGSVRVLAGNVAQFSDNVVVFRVGGTPGERISFVFRLPD
jgi:hypothetical protein